MSERVTIVAEAPLRVSFVGGGTDLPSFYESFGGEVISLTLGFRVSVTVTGRTDRDIWVRLPVFPGPVGRAGAGTARLTPPTRLAGATASGGLELVRGAVAFLGGERGLDVTVGAQVPPGSGLGSSGALTVALAGAITGLRGRALEAEDAAELAYHVEARACGSPVGKQDHYSAAFGGLNRITFLPRGQGIRVKRLDLGARRLDELTGRLLLFHTPRRSNSRVILGDQNQRCKDIDRKTVGALNHLKALCDPVERILQEGDPAELGPILDQAWRHKRALASGITDPALDAIYELAVSSGATGGKLCGAGAGGCFLFCCPPEDQEGLRRVLVGRGLVEYGVAASTRGLEVAILGQEGGALARLDDLARTEVAAGREDS